VPKMLSCEPDEVVVVATLVRGPHPVQCNHEQHRYNHRCRYHEDVLADRFHPIWDDTRLESLTTLEKALMSRYWQK